MSTKGLYMHRIQATISDEAKQILLVGTKGKRLTSEFVDGAIILADKKGYDPFNAKNNSSDGRKRKNRNTNKT